MNVGIVAVLIYKNIYDENVRRKFIKQDVLTISQVCIILSLFNVYHRGCALEIFTLRSMMFGLFISKNGYPL